MRNHTAEQVVGPVYSQGVCSGNAYQRIAGDEVGAALPDGLGQLLGAV